MDDTFLVRKELNPYERTRGGGEGVQLIFFKII